MYHKLVAKINSIYTSEFVLTLSIIENKIPETSDLIKKTDYNTKITEIESKIPGVSNLATKYLMLVVLLLKQIITLKLLKLKINLVIMIMINILLLQSLTL